MAYTIIIFTLAALFCQAQSQLCVTPGIVPQVLANQPIVTAPQMVASPMVATTIVDNSVSTALANALQLLIVSDIIESKLGASCLNNLFNINPALETVSPCYPRADYITPCAAPAEIISPCRPVIETIVPNYGATDIIYNKPYGVIEPYSYMGCSEVLTPNLYETVPNFGCSPCGNEIIVNPCLSNTYLPELVTPRNYYGVAEVMSPNYNPYNGCGVEVMAANPFAPICGNEIVTIPSYNPGCYGGYNEVISPIPYNSCGEVITPCNPCGVTEVISPCGPYYGGVPEVVAPWNSGCFVGNVSPCKPGCGMPEVFTPCSLNYGGIPEVISSVYRPGCVGIPEYVPGPFGPCRIPEYATPCANNFPEVIMPAPYINGFSGCDFCGPPAFSPNFCF